MKKALTIHVAVADDHSIVRKAVIDLLAYSGIETIAEGGNGQELIANIESATVEPDICILDIEMPYMNGYETIKILNRRWPSMRTIVFTMHNNEYALIKMISYGAKGFVAKGGPFNELLTAVKDVYYDGYYYSELEVNVFSNRKNVDEFKKYYLNEREIEFIKLCCSEMTYKEIADKMNSSMRTIDGYREDLFLKLQLKSRVGLVLFAIEACIVSL